MRKIKSHLKMIIIYFCLLLAIDSLSVQHLLAQNGVLQFKSGFEDGVSSTGSKIIGVDRSSEPSVNDWDKIPQYLGWPAAVSSFLQGGSISITTDPVNSLNKVLLLHNTSPSPEKPDKNTRTQYQIFQVKSWTDPGEGPNLFNQQFYRYRVYIPGDIASVVPFNTAAPWYMIWESHNWVVDLTRHGIYLTKKKDSDLWYFEAQQQLPEGTNVWKSKTTVGIPFDRWFTLEVYFKYHETEGEFYVAIVDGDQRNEVVRYQGRTQNGAKLHDQMIFKSYHHISYLTELNKKGIDGTRLYYDDFEIWSDYPPEYWSLLSNRNEISDKGACLEKINVMNSPYKGNGSVILTNVPENARISIYSLNGSVIQKSLSVSSDGQFIWNGKAGGGNLSLPGLYFARITNKDQMKMMKLLFVP
jgi:hypothetical protein